MSNVFRSIILTFLSCFSFISAKADLNPITRLYLSDKGYAKNMEVQTYLITRDQLVPFFAEGKINQKLNKEFHENDEKFLLVRIKNNGDHFAFGSLECNVPNCDMPIVITMVSSHGSHYIPYQDWIVPLTNLAINILEGNEIPKITYKWTSLYSY